MTITDLAIVLDRDSNGTELAIVGGQPYNRSLFGA